MVSTGWWYGVDMVVTWWWEGGERVLRGWCTVHHISTLYLQTYNSPGRGWWTFTCFCLLILTFIQNYEWKDNPLYVRVPVHKNTCRIKKTIWPSTIPRPNQSSIFSKCKTLWIHYTTFDMLPDSGGWARVRGLRSPWGSSLSWRGRGVPGTHSARVQRELQQVSGPLRVCHEH